MLRKTILLFSLPSIGVLAVISCSYPFKKKSLSYLELIQEIGEDELTVEFLKRAGEKAFSVKEGDTDIPVNFATNDITDRGFVVNNRNQYIVNELFIID